MVPSELIKSGTPIEFQSLPVADYIVNNTAIERKTIADLESSIISKRIFSQTKELKQYQKHFLFVEGDFSHHKPAMHENAIRGFILSVLSSGTPIIFTSNEKDTAKYIALLANKKEKSNFSIRPSKINLTSKEQVQFILEGFPNIGPSSAKKLLDNFKSLKNIFSVSEIELEKVIGKKSSEFFKLLHHEHEPSQT